MSGEDLTLTDLVWYRVTVHHPHISLTRIVMSPDWTARMERAWKAARVWR